MRAQRKRERRRLVIGGVIAGGAALAAVVALAPTDTRVSPSTNGTTQSAATEVVRGERPSIELAGDKADRRSVVGAFTCTVASVTDGDTFRCQEADISGRQIRVRVSGIAARETDGSCSPGHPCPSATAEAATAALSRLITGQRLSCESAGRTHGRIAAFCRREDGTDISCAMVDSGTALRWDRHWGAHRCG